MTYKVASNQPIGLHLQFNWSETIILGGPLYALEDGLFRVANWEDQTKEDLAPKFCERREKIANFSP